MEVDAFGDKIDPSKPVTVVGTSGRLTVKTRVRPYETIKDAKIRCAIELEKKIEGQYG